MTTAANALCISHHLGHFFPVQWISTFTNANEVLQLFVIGSNSGLVMILAQWRFHFTNPFIFSVINLGWFVRASFFIFPLPGVGLPSSVLVGCSSQLQRGGQGCDVSWVLISCLLLGISISSTVICFIIFWVADQPPQQLVSVSVNANQQPSSPSHRTGQSPFVVIRSTGTSPVLSPKQREVFNWSKI